MHTAKRAYATTAQAVGRGLTRIGVLSDEPPPLDRRLRHWAYSLTKVHDSLAIARLDVPWWTYDAIAAVTQWFEERTGPVRVFEYGSGASTLWLARRASYVHSVEHHRGFGEMVAGELAGLDHVELQIVEPEVSAQPRVPSAKEGHQGLDFARYVAAIDSVPGSFDLVVVDGRAREACLAAAQDRLAPGGIIVFDNTRRRRYREAIGRSGMAEERYTGLTPTLPYPDQTSILRAV
ncbi:class I SAM-dependent methyltransferase [Nocardioides mesophilus]|uniref:Class I SAM-dependent methyltransferase n=1 Tax=Nocardioides mesophilus TaxID=433659 RepID=A0A7G9RHK5_9ACTN|nr:class I SAM-dependent methyltransferase [Nocardioides mesophilus]